MTHKIQLFKPFVNQDEERMMAKVFKSNFWASGSGSGTVLKFENEFKKYLKSDECIAVNSGTSALNLALSLFNIKDKEVILPSLSFVSTANCVLQNGGIPIFADVDPKTLCLEPESVRKLINKKTKAVIPVHFGGMPCNMEYFSQLSKKYGIKVIEDAAHAAGSSFNRKRIGSHSSVSYTHLTLPTNREV